MPLRLTPGVGCQCALPPHCAGPSGEDGPDVGPEVPQRPAPVGLPPPPRRAAAERDEHRCRDGVLAPPAAPRQRSILEAGGAHGLAEGSVNACLAPPHGLQGVPEGDGRQAVGRGHADVEGNKAIPPCRTGEYVGRAEARRGREEAESLGFSVGVAAAGEGEQAVACLVVPPGGRAWRAAKGVGSVNHTATAANTAHGVGGPPGCAESQADGVDVDVGLKGVPRRRGEGVQPVVADAVIAEVPDTSLVMAPPSAIASASRRSARWQSTRPAMRRCRRGTARMRA